MSSRHSPVRNANRPTIVLRRLRELQSYEVLETDLVQLDQLVADENRALGFASLSAGAFVGLLTTALTFWLSARVVGTVLVGLLSTTLLATLWLATAWRRARLSRPRLLSKIIGDGRSEPPAAPTATSPP
jgi:hypothetical protein